MASKGSNQFVSSLKQGLKDIKTVVQEGNFKLFAKQIVVIVVFVFILRYAYGKFNAQISQDQEQMNSIGVQQQSAQDYMANKNKLLILEPRFPDISIKNEWLLSKILGIFKEQDITPQIDGSQSEDNNNPTFVAVGQTVGMNMEFMPLAHFVEKIENEEDYLRISEVSITKNTDPNSIGDNKVTLRFNTIFPKEKIGAKMFSDYSQLVQDKRTEKKSKGATK